MATCRFHLQPERSDYYYYYYYYYYYHYFQSQSRRSPNQIDLCSSVEFGWASVNAA